MVFCALVALLAGCNRGDPPLTEEGFCQEYARIECGKVTTFCSFDPASCESVRVQACRGNAARLKAGGHSFNPGNTDRCLKKLEEAYRTLPINAMMLQAVEEVCDRVFEGTAKMLEPCIADFDCVGGLICDKGKCATEKVVPPRSQCANFGETCSKGEYCTNASGSFLCTPRQDRDAPCSLSQPCKEEYRCVTTCQPRRTIGEACASDDDCLSGYCNRYLDMRTCGPGLTFSPGSATCLAYMSGDASVPVRGPTSGGDGGTDSSTD
jgi:hypothetical protein